MIAVGCKKCNDYRLLWKNRTFRNIKYIRRNKRINSKRELLAIDIRKKAIEEDYRPLVVDGINKSTSWRHNTRRSKLKNYYILNIKE